MVAEGTNRTYNHIGLSDSFHPVSHHANDMGRLEKLVKIQTWHVERFANFVGKLAAVPDGDGTLLDHSMVLFGGGMGDGNLHRHADLPCLMAGKLGGAFKPGRHLRYPADTPMANLLLTVLDAAGVPIEKLGDSTGRLPIEPLSTA
jgi:hypothetical protein